MNKTLMITYNCTITKINKKCGVGIKFINPPHITKYFLPFWLFKDIDLTLVNKFDMRVFDDFSVSLENFK